MPVWQHAGMPPDLRRSSDARDRLLVARLDALVPALMDRAGLDAWVVAGREHAEDPVLRTMLPATWLGTARRRTILLFLRTGDTVRRMAIARYAVGDAFAAAWDPEAQPDQWQRVAELLAEADPARIGIDTSATFALADGLAASERDALLQRLPPALAARVVGAEVAALGWLETRLPEERPSLVEACRVSHGYLRRALSGEAIEPGRTTTADVEWWLRDAVDADGYGSWFHPTCSVQRPGGSVRDSFAAAPGATVIEPGDLVHVDFGIVRDGYCTDQQQHAYVLRPAERRAPAGILRGMAAANRLQDLLLAALAAGGTGNEGPAADARGGGRGGDRRARVHAPHRPPRSRRRRHDRPVGPPGRRRRRGRLPGPIVDGLVDRAAGEARGTGVERPGGAVHARGGRLARCRRQHLPRRPPGGTLAHLTREVVAPPGRDPVGRLDRRRRAPGGDP